MVVFVIAFVLDTTTGHRWTSIWGSAAILLSLGIGFPAVRPWMLAGGSYISVWVAFNLGRAVADVTPWAAARLYVVRDIEASLAGGQLPTVWLQEAIFSPGDPRWHDTFATLIYLSYFVVPHGVALVLLFRDRACFHRYLLATASLFLLSAICFVLLPTNPPWRATEAIRVVPAVLAEMPGGAWLDTAGDSRAGYHFEPNPIASWPSVHLGVTVILALLATGTSRRWTVVGFAYAMLMVASLVYLGEHYVVDVVVGALVAVLTWSVARRRVRPPHRAAAAPIAPNAPRPLPGTAPPRRSESAAGAPHTA